MPERGEQKPRPKQPNSSSCRSMLCLGPARVEIDIRGQFRPYSFPPVLHAPLIEILVAYVKCITV
jgi:hypothetical protein